MLSLGRPMVGTIPAIPEIPFRPILGPSTRSRIGLFRADCVPSRPDRDPEHQEITLKVEEVISGTSRRSAGTTHFVEGLCRELSNSHEVTLHSLGSGASGSRAYRDVEYRGLPLAASLGISRSMKLGLVSAARNADVMHSHGLWMMPNVYPGWATRGTGTALVVSPHGMLMPAARALRPRRKTAFWRLLQGPALTEASCFHATSAVEADSIRASGLSGPIAIVPIGVTVPTEVKSSQTTSRTLLYLGRLHPIKNVDGLIHAWQRISMRHREWTLVIAGPGDPGYVQELRKLATRGDRIQIRAAVDGQAKADLYGEADVFVLPSHSENFGLTVAEALSHGVPVVATRRSPWSRIEQKECGWWVEPELDSLATTLDAALGESYESLQSRGRAGRAWMARDFSWQHVGAMMGATYDWVAGHGQRPEFVVLD